VVPLARPQEDALIRFDETGGHLPRFRGVATFHREVDARKDDVPAELNGGSTIAAHGDSVARREAHIPTTPPTRLALLDRHRQILNGGLGFSPSRILPAAGPA
jgi:hypothetical protein